MKKLVITFCIIFFTVLVKAQTPGIIVRPNSGAGPAVLDPNADGYTSLTTTGFANGDIANSELPYKMVAPVIAEPTGDLLRGPSGSFSDIVKTLDGSGFYLYSDAANLLCRLRIGGIVSGSKGYSILLDTDQKFGPSGPNADPTFHAATNGNNGNPGFEFEVVFETNFRIAVYNVDSGSTPKFVTSYALTTNSQVSIAATADGNNFDFFYDFYVPLTALGLNAGSLIRATATTVMAPKPAIGGPKSDIYGLGGNDYMSDWTNIIFQQPAFAISNVNSGGSGISGPCTAAPVIEQSLTSDSTTVKGTWNNSSYSTFTSATIKVYNGITEIGTTTATLPGGHWSIPVINLPDGSIITAKAQAGTESMCFTSNEVKVANCTDVTQTATPTIDCATDRGFEGTRPIGATIELYMLTSAGAVLIGSNTTTYKIIYPDGLQDRWYYAGENQGGGQGCNGGARDIDDGVYMAIATLAPGCASAPAFRCIDGTASTTAAPSVSSLLIDGISTISGDAPAGSGLVLFIDSNYIKSTTATTSGKFTFTLTDKLSLNQQVVIRAVTTMMCASTAFTGKVTCYVAAPVITANSADSVTADSLLTGTSSANAGSTISIYNATNQSSLGTATVLANGTWTMASPAIAASMKYYAKVTGHICDSSAASNTVTGTIGTSPDRCGSISTPLNDAVATISGSVTSNVVGTAVVLFVDGDSIGTVTTSNLVWTIPVNTTVYNKLYSGAELTFSIAEPGKTAATCTAREVVPNELPMIPNFDPVTTTITAGQSVTYTISGSQSGILYSVRDNADLNSAGGSIFGNGSTVTTRSDAFNTPGTYNLKITATSFTCTPCATTANATVTVLGALPLSLTTFNGMYDHGIVKLIWETVFEQDIEKFEIERSTNSTDFKKIGEVTAVGNSTLRNTYLFDDADAKSDVLYYRLRIIDRSTRVDKFSKVVVIRTDKGIVINQVAPNPFTDIINMSFNASGKMPLIINLKDMAGRTIRVVKYTTKKGFNNIPVNDLQRVSSGTYVLEVIAGGDRIHKELLIKR